MADSLQVVNCFNLFGENWSNGKTVRRKRLNGNESLQNLYLCDLCNLMKTEDVKFQTHQPSEKQILNVFNLVLFTQIIYQSPGEVTFRGVFLDMNDYT